MSSRVWFLFCAAFACAVASGASPPQASGFYGSPPGAVLYRTQAGAQEPPLRYAAPDGANPALRLAWWNEAIQRASARDHAPPTGGTDAYVPEQLDPTRASRVFAIVHLAIYDALAAICGRYRPYGGALPAYADSSRDAAIAQSAHDTLAALYPRQRERLDAWLRDDLARLPDNRAKRNGIDVGRRVAAAILALRASDGDYDSEPVVGQDYQVSNEPGQWRPDPVSRIPVAVGAYWQIQPFVMQTPAQFRPPPPPALTSGVYTRSFNEVKSLGGDGIRTPTRRTADQTAAGLFWAYDGVAWIGTPANLYNQIAVQLALRRSSDPMEVARALALVNVAIADAAIAVWEAKYYYDFWRPVTGIREADPGSGPTGRGDGNPDTLGDPGWTPLGAPASNLVGLNFTPPFPAYPSSHAGLGGAALHMLRRLYSDKQSFTFVSDELNGITRDNRGKVRPRLPRSFRTLSQAEEENGQSRIYLGIHWQFDKTAGMDTAHKVADYVFARGLLPPAR